MWPNLTKESQVLTPEFKVPTLKEDGSNVADFYVADVIGNKAFAKNYGGYPRSDIALINEQTNISVARSMLEALPELPESSPAADGEYKLSLRSKYCQTPSEVISYLEDELEKRDNFYKSKVASASSSAGSDKSDKSDDDIVDNV